MNFKRLAIALVMTCSLTYLVDGLSFYRKGRHPTRTQPIETVTYSRLLAIQDKGNKVEYAIDSTHPQETVSCAHSIFPHAGFSPCWVALRNVGKPIPMTLLPFSVKSLFPPLSLLSIRPIANLPRKFAL